MTLLEPAALAALIALPLIVLLYILRPRHQRLVIPSVRLWEHLASDLEGRPRWRLPLASLLLLVQLLVAGGVAFALARPALPGAIRQHLILLVDTSPTMDAVDVKPNRLQLAIRDAKLLTTSLGPDDQVTLVAIAPIPYIVASGTGPSAVNTALTDLKASPASGDVHSAMALAAQIAAKSRDTHNRIVVLSDGTFNATALKNLGSIPADVSFKQIGGSDDNQGITALSVRPMIGSANRFLGFTQITNFSHGDARIGFEALADGLAIDRRQLTVPALGHVELSLPLPQGTREFKVVLSTSDKYAADNQADVLVPAQSVVPVTVVASDPAIWEQALKTLPNVRLHLLTPEAYHPDGAAVTIFDGFVPAQLPPGNVMLIAPPEGNALVSVVGGLGASTVLDTENNNPLFDSVDLTGLYVPQAERMGAVPWAHSIADVANGSVMLEGQDGGHRIVVIGFEPSATTWPQRVAFPIFVANAIQTLSPAEFPTQIDPGKVLDIQPTMGATRLLVRTPNGKVDVFKTSGRSIRFTDTSQSGRYVVTEVNGSRSLSSHEFVAGLPSVSESNIAPRVDPQNFSRTASPPGKPSEHEVWPWVAGGALLLLSAEWLLYFRRVGI